MYDFFRLDFCSLYKYTIFFEKNKKNVKKLQKISTQNKTHLKVGGFQLVRKY